MPNPDDKRTIRCKRLGHEVPFYYCRTQEGNRVCPAILNCWWEIFDVQSVLRKQLPPEEFDKLTRPSAPKPKIASIIEIIEEAKRHRR